MKPADVILRLLYPPKCVFCHRLLKKDDGEDAVCADCRRSIEILSYPACMVIPPDYIDGCYAPMYYEGDVRNSLLRYKFNGNSFYSETYAEIVCSAFTSGELDCDIVTWVPLARKRMRKRGYDQAMLIAKGIADRLAVPCLRTLVKVKNIRPQSSVGDAAERRNNIKNAYVPYEKYDLRGKKILLVDDIVTTGSTFSECARVLRNSGASVIKAVAVARRKE